MRRRYTAGEGRQAHRAPGPRPAQAGGGRRRRRRRLAAAVRAWAFLAASATWARSAAGQGDPQDIFFLLKESSPREAAIHRELRLWINATSRPWDTRRVVATMTTTPKRITIIEPALDSLLQQTRAPDAVYLFIPHVFKRDGSVYELPPWLPAKRGLTVIRCEDSGPATHMLEVLKVERHPQTYILQVDDDQHYGKELLEGLLRASGPMPGRAVGGATQHAHTHIRGIVLEGVHGVLFQRKFFDPGVFDHSGFAPECRLHDDLWLSAHLAKRAVGREQLGSRFGSRALLYGFGDDALYKGGAGSDNIRNFYVCTASLLRRHPRLWEVENRVVIIAPLLRHGPGEPRPTAAAAAAAMRRLRRLRRLPGLGPHAVYLRGPTPRLARPAEVPDRPHFSWPGGWVQHVGGWGETVDIFVQDCGSAPTGCSLSKVLEFALALEEDPETLVVLVDRPVANSAFAARLLESHLRCHREDPAGPKSRETCRGPWSSTSFWRHAAYDESRIQGGVFLPSFSPTFHLSRAEGTHLPGQGTMWRDDYGPWRHAEPEGLAFTKYATSGQVLDPAVKEMWEGFAQLQRRVVASLGTTVARLPHLGLVISSLLRQRQKLRKVYVFARTIRQVERCATAAISSRPRVEVLCGPWASSAQPVLALLSRETSPGTLLLLCDDAHHYGPGLLAHLVSGLDIFTGSSVAARGYTFGKHGGPIPIFGLGFLMYRSFLDTSMLDLLSGACATQPEMALAAHFVNKGVHVRALGDNFGTRRLNRATRRHIGDLSACRGDLLRSSPMLWASRFPERCVPFVALLEGTDDFLLDMTIRYAALQTRKPDEVVLLAMNGNILEEQVMRRRALNDAELEVHGRLGSGTTIVRTRDGREANISLPRFLAGLRDRTGCVVRVHSEFGEPRSFVLSVVNIVPCPDGKCTILPTLFRAFEHELDPDTVLFFTSAERLVNERCVAENLGCVSACKPKCSRHSWCGQSTTRRDGAIYDLTLRRVAGYVDHTPV